MQAHSHDEAAPPVRGYRQCQAGEPTESNPRHQKEGGKFSDSRSIFPTLVSTLLSTGRICHNTSAPPMDMMTEGDATPLTDEGVLMNSSSG